MISLISRLWGAISQQRRQQFVLLLCVMLLASFAEMATLGAVLPFISIITGPERLFAIPYVKSAAGFLGFQSPGELVLAITVVFMLSALASGVLRIWSLRLSTKLAYGVSADISLEVYRRTLYQPYQVHVARNSSELISGIINKTNAVTSVLTSLLLVLISSVLLLAIAGTLMAVNPIVATVAGIGFGVAYVSVTLMSRRSLELNSKLIAREQSQVTKALQEGLGGIRDILLDASQSVYCSIYRRSNLPMQDAMARNTVISQSPRYAMEAVGMILLAFLAYGLSFQSAGVNDFLPSLGAMALGAQRLLPVLQQVYGGWTNVVGQRYSLLDVLILLEQPLVVESDDSKGLRLPFFQTVSLKSVKFKYAITSSFVLDDFSLDITKGSRVGIVGKTGSGKSTVLDVLMGLLRPTEGCLVVDGQLISDTHLQVWQRNIAHVPQAIFLADTSLAENIAFGVPIHDIDYLRVREAARQAQIADFIESRPEGYEAIVGERGVRLSGGQRQRIGIARALYKQASVLIFDEATSALDAATEQGVMSAIQGLNRELTLIIVAHRLTTVRECDVIIQIEQGKVVAQGTYSELFHTNSHFKAMAQPAV